MFFSVFGGTHHLTPDIKIYFENVILCQFSSGKWFLRTKFVQGALAWKLH